MKINKLYLALLMLGSATVAVAQTPMSLYFMETIPQSAQLNPALHPRANVYVTGPSFGFDMTSDLAVNDIFQKHGKQWYLPIESQYDYDKLRKSIGRRAVAMTGSFDITLLGFGFRAGNGYVNFAISEHLTGQMAMPSDLFKIPERGFPDGTSLDFSPLGFKAMAYKEILLGYSTHIGDKLSVGVNVKPLFGQIAVKSAIDRFNIKTSVEQWDVDVKGNVYVSGPFKITENEKGDISGVESAKDDLGLDEAGDWIQKYGTSFSNPGIAFDLGAAYELTDKIQLSASLTNLGFISWKEDLSGIAFNGKYSFNGIDYDVVEDEDNDNVFDQVTDSLQNAVHATIAHDKFSTMLSPSLYVGGKYQIIKGISVGLLSRTTFHKNAVRQNFNLSAYLQPYSFVAFNAGINYRVKGSVYLGTGLTLLLGPFQIYMLADLPMHYSKVYLNDTANDTGSDMDNFIPLPTRQKDVTFRFGFNLVFGKHGYQNKPMFDRSVSAWQ